MRLIKKIKAHLLRIVADVVTAYVYRFQSRNYKLQVATDEQTKEKIYRFRYEVYQNEFFFETGGESKDLKLIKEKEDDSPYTRLFYEEDKNNQMIFACSCMIFPPGKVLKTDQESSFYFARCCCF